MEIKIIYEDNDVLVIDKPAGIVVFPKGDRPGTDQGQTRDRPGTDHGLSPKTVVGLLVEKYPGLKNAGEAPRYGMVHRLDKDTSGILLAAKNNESLKFLQKQFSPYGGSLEGRKNTLEKKAEKRYIALAEGNIKQDTGVIHTRIGRSPMDKRKQKVYLAGDPTSEGKREAITKYRVLERYENYTLLEVEIKTGRRHQIRCHFSYLQHPIAGDKMYGFKNSSWPKGLDRQFLHAAYLKIRLPSGEIKEFKSELPEELKKVLRNLKLK